MAMNGTDLGDAMMAAVDALTTPNKQARAKVFESLGIAIVTYLTAHAIVTVPSVSGVTTGSGVSGPGTGTIS